MGYGDLQMCFNCHGLFNITFGGGFCATCEMKIFDKPTEFVKLKLEEEEPMDKGPTMRGRWTDNGFKETPVACIGCSKSINYADQYILWNGPEYDGPYCIDCCTEHTKKTEIKESLNLYDSNMELFDRAREIVNGRRQEDYGTPEDNFANIAKAWSGVIGTKLNSDITPQEVALMMTALKLVREANQHKDDNIVDGAGYLLLAERLKP